VNVRIRAAAAAMLWGAAFFIGSQSAYSADPPAGKVAVAYVDTARLMNESKAVAALQVEFQEYRKGQQKQLDDLYAGRFLDDQERTELESLQKVATRSSTQNDRITELAKLSDAREQEAKRLSVLEKPTDDERARLTQLSNWADKQNQRAAQLQDAIEKDAQQKSGQMNQRALASLQDAVKSVAQEKGIDMVIDRQAVLFSIDGRDLTDAVMQKINGGSAAAPKSGGASPVKSGKKSQ
jgi:Skp family chaperone for outer membrane proteins